MVAYNNSQSLYQIRVTKRVRTRGVTDEEYAVGERRRILAVVMKHICLPTYKYHRAH